MSSTDTAPHAPLQSAPRPSWRALTGALLGQSDRPGLVSRTGTSADAATVLWQNRLRILSAAAALSLVAALDAGGWIAGATRWTWITAAAYVAAVFVIGALVRRRGRAGVAILFALALADLGVIFVTVATLASPRFYAATLFLSLLALQLAHAFLGVAPALLVVGGTVLGYAALVTAAAGSGILDVTRGEAWLLVAYLAVAVNAVVLHSRFNRRLAQLVDLFGLAERGDFEREYVDRGDHAEDGLTLVGRAYNHLRSELAALVLTDPLTGSLNRRGFEQELGRAVSRAAREGSELALLAVDVDHFKRINDSFGHLAGDTVLRELAEVLAHTARTEDVLGRVGGDELLVLLPGADLEAAGVVAERISNVVRGHHFITTRGRERVTVSIGIAAEHVRDPYLGHALRARADEALYVAKRLGRDRVVMWAPGIRSEATPPQPLLAVDLDALHTGNGSMRRLGRAD